MFLRYFRRNQSGFKAKGEGEGEYVFRELAKAHLNVTCSPVQVEVQVLDLAILGKLVVDGLLVRLFVHVGHHDDPALDGPHRRRFSVRLHVAHFGLRLRGRRRLVHIHLDVRHGLGFFFLLGFLLG